MKKLIIAEKPSLARNITDAIQENFEKKDGCYESQGYIVSYAFGHLFGLVDIEEYLGQEKSIYKWTLNNLPFFPKEFQFDIKKSGKELDEGAKSQFQILSKLMNRSDVSEIIHCGDADREGEVIIRLIIQKGLKQKKKISRLWLPEQTGDTIRHSLENLKDDSEYDNLFQEGLTRTYIDWLYGINFTRYVTLKAGQIFHVGRVLTPIVSAIYEKEMEIKNFVAEKFLKAESKETTGSQLISLTLPEKWPLQNMEKVKEICQAYNQAEAIVTEIQTEDIKKRPGKLYSLSKLQGVLGKKYKMSMKDSLSAVQALYEKGYVTYPRTNTEYLAENEKGRIQKILQLFIHNGYEVEFKDSKTIFNDAKLESHSALTPTEKLPENLTESEAIVYEIIKNRFLSVFCAEDCLMEHTTISISCIEHFNLSGNVIKQKGFLKFEPLEKDTALLPNLKVGDLVNHKFMPVEKTTLPPDRYTVDSLNQFLKNPFKKDGNEEEEYRSILEGTEIGTEATRTGIIGNAISNGYISLNNNKYALLKKGETVINILQDLEIDMSKTRTVYLQKLLKLVYRGERCTEDVLIEVKNQILESFKNRDRSLTVQIEAENRNTGKESIGICPKCGGKIYETSKAYSCESTECKFALWKEGNKFFEAIGFSPIKEDFVKFLSEGKTLAKNLISKKGTNYNAYIKANFSAAYPKWDMEFLKKKKWNGKK